MTEHPAGYRLLEHDHDWTHKEGRESPDLGGATAIEECGHPECEAWRARWVDQTTLAGFGGRA